MSSQPLTARTEFAAAINQICNERGIDPEVVLDTIKSAILAAFRKDFPDSFEEVELEEYYTVELDEETGAAKIINTQTNEDVTPPGFGRIAAQTAKQVILQRVREAEKDAIINEYEDRVGTVISGMVLRFDGKNVIVDIGRGQGFMPPEEQIRGEYYKMNQRLAVYISDIRETMRGKTIIVSRSAPELVVELFRREVPEVASDAVEIKAIAREAGYRTKIAVNSTQEGVDPVGSCVGQKGVRVQEVINELGGEKIDIIQFSDSPKTFIAASLAPAEGLHIELDEDNQAAVVTVPDDQLSLAIGKGGQNVRLAAKLTGYKIDIKGQSGEEVTSSTTITEETPIDALELPADIVTFLGKAGIQTVSQLQTANLEEIKNIDEEAQETINQVLKELEGKLQKEPQVEPTQDSSPESDPEEEGTSEKEVQSEDGISSAQDDVQTDSDDQPQDSSTDTEEESNSDKKE